MQVRDFIETGLPRRLFVQFALLTAGGGPGRGWRYRNGHQCRRNRCSCLRRSADGAMMLIKDTCQGVAKIAQKMPPIRNLNRIRSTGPHAVGIVAGAIVGDDLDAGMRLQPRLDSLGFAVTQQIDRSVFILQIDDDGAVASAPPPCPVVDADDAWGRRYRNGSHPDQAQQGVAADRHGKPARQAGAGLTAGMQGNAALRLGKADGPPNPRQDHLRQAFGEDPARALGSGAAKATDLKIEMADPTLPGKISEMPDVSAMYPARAAAAQGTGRCGGASTDPYDHAIRVDDDLLNRKAGWEQGQQRIGHGEDSTL
jgi:hypothetical protein